MDNSPDGVSPDLLNSLSYDDSIAYEEQLPAQSLNDSEPSLANRIGNTKVYLLAESSVTRVGKSYITLHSFGFFDGKRKHVEENGDAAEDNDEDMDEDTTYRPNALLLQGPPIAHLPTAGLFAYATHFDTHPMGLEWVDDNTCVFVFPSKAAARTAHRNLCKAAIEEPDTSGFITAKPIPIALWPPEERINTSLGKGQGLKGPLRMRWALIDDVKKKGAKRESAFYKKHGTSAGKEVYGNDTNAQPVKRRRRGDDSIHTDFAATVTKAELDEQLDEFLAEDDEEHEPAPPPSPPSKMRSDYIATDGRTLLERTSLIRAHPGPKPESLADRIMAPLPRRARNGGGGGRVGKMYSESLEEGVRPEELLEWGNAGERVREDTRRKERGAGGRRDGRQRQARVAQPRSKTQQELDDELDAFLNEKE